MEVGVRAKVRVALGDGSGRVVVYRIISYMKVKMYDLIQRASPISIRYDTMS